MNKLTEFLLDLTIYRHLIQDLKNGGDGVNCEELILINLVNCAMNSGLTKALIAELKITLSFRIKGLFGECF